MKQIKLRTLKEQNLPAFQRLAKHVREDCELPVDDDHIAVRVRNDGVLRARVMGGKHWHAVAYDGRRWNNLRESA
jgi:hypothetical protein